MNSTTTQLVFDRDGHRYELRELSKEPKQFKVQRVADEAATSTPVWQVTFDGDVLRSPWARRPESDPLAARNVIHLGT